LSYSDLGTNNLINQGTLQATAANTTLRINPTGAFTNAAGGQVVASGGGAVTIATANWVNQGMFVVNAGTLNLTADFAAAGVGTVTRTGGTINLAATATVAAGATFDLQAFGGNVNLLGGRVLGGSLTSTLASTGAARLVPNNDGNNRLDGVMVAGNV